MLSAPARSITSTWALAASGRYFFRNVVKLDCEKAGRNSSVAGQNHFRQRTLTDKSSDKYIRLALHIRRSVRGRSVQITETSWRHTRGVAGRGHILASSLGSGIRTRLDGPRSGKIGK